MAGITVAWWCDCCMSAICFMCCVNFKAPTEAKVASDPVKPSGTICTRRPWAGRRRPRSTDKRDEATDKISSLAELQRAYLQEKMERKRQEHQLFLAEHQQRMELLDLQKQLCVKQLQQLEE